MKKKVSQDKVVYTVNYIMLKRRRLWISEGGLQ